MNAEEARKQTDEINVLVKNREEYSRFLARTLLYPEIDKAIQSAILKGKYSFSKSYDPASFMGTNSKFIIRKVLKEVEETYKTKNYKISTSAYGSPMFRDDDDRVYDFSIFIEW
jgi:hypothetical protein